MGALRECAWREESCLPGARAALFPGQCGPAVCQCVLEFSLMLLVPWLALLSPPPRLLLIFYLNIHVISTSTVVPMSLLFRIRIGIPE